MLLFTVILSVSVGLVFIHTMFYGAPFLPTQRRRVEEAFDLLDLKPGQTLLELGSGDGRILRAAARRGITAIGYELNPLLVIYSRLRCYKYRRLVTVHARNYWLVPLPRCDAVYVFLLNPYMQRLDSKISTEVMQPVKLLSFAFQIPGKVPVKQSNGIMLYSYQPVAQPA